LVTQSSITVVLLLAAVAQPARADLDDDPDTEIAKRYFQEGFGFYARADYPHALERFLAAQRIRSLPEMDYNIARCHDRMDHPAEAIAAYERYLAASPERNDDVRARLAVLRTRLAPFHRRRAYLAPGLIAGLALGLGVAGTALWTSDGPEWNKLQMRWSGPEGSSPLVQDRARQLRAQDYAGYAMWGLAAAAVVADVVLWVVTARREHARAPGTTRIATWAF
jgi:hypothetical protein